MWLEMKNPEGKRLLLNLELTFCFVEQPDGSAQAVSLQGVGAPVGATFDEVRDNIAAQE